MRPRDFKRMTLRTHVISIMRFDGHFLDTFRMANRQLTDTCNSGLTCPSSVKNGSLSETKRTPVR